MPTLLPYVTEAICQQFATLLPGLGRRNIRLATIDSARRSSRSCAGGGAGLRRCLRERSANESCQATTLGRRRRKERIAGELMVESVAGNDARSSREVRAVIGRRGAADCCIKGPLRRRDGRQESLVENGARYLKRSTAVDSGGIPLRTASQRQPPRLLERTPAR
ncbi:MAG: hypothetical protein M3315_11360 [Actinomycetota bacterium]|nr:hypothetical protein [Actinomycetota bacterium]